MFHDLTTDAIVRDTYVMVVISSTQRESVKMKTKMAALMLKLNNLMYRIHWILVWKGKTNCMCLKASVACFVFDCAQDIMCLAP